MRSKAGFDEFIPYWNASLFLFGVGLAGRALEPFIGYRAIGFLFLLAVLLTGFLGRLGPVLFAATISWLSWNYFFIPPRFTFTIGAPEDVLMCATYFFVAIVTGILANRIKSQEAVIREREERTNFLYEVMKDLSDLSQKEFIARITDRLSNVLDGRVEVILNPVGGPTTSFEDDEALFVPIKGNEETVGVCKFVPTHRAPLSLDQENLLQSVCRQIGITIERGHVEQRLREAERLRESEKVHQTLLNSISHEIRTPLTVIIGSASALEKAQPFKSETSTKLIAGELKRASERLNRVVENLLDMSRISAGGIAIKREWHDVSDLVGVTVSRLDLGERRLKVDVPTEIPLVQMDFRLIEHALSNILFNAVTYSPAGTEIAIHAEPKQGHVLIRVDDAGPGIPPEYLPNIFDKFFRVPGSPPGGTGLGLSIAKSIVELHGGSIAARNRKEGGVSFELSLPLTKSPELPKDIHG